MKFQQRLNRYLIGVALGLVLVMLMFNGRNWLGWLPQNQVRGRIEAADLSWTEKCQCQLICMGYSVEDVKAFAIDADVIFSESQRDNDPKEYQLEWIDQGQRSRMRFQFLPLGESINPPVKVIEVDLPNMEACDCD